MRLLLEALIDAAPHAQVGYHGHLLTEHLARLVGRYPKEVADIYKAALTGFLPDYEKKDVVGYITGLAQAGEVEEAEWICNEYAKRESTLLKETYETIRLAQRVRAGADDNPASEG